MVPRAQSRRANWSLMRIANESLTRAKPALVPAVLPAGVNPDRQRNSAPPRERDV